MLVELAVAEQRYRAVLEVLEGATVTEVARRFGVARQTVHAWLRRYATNGGMGNLADRSSRPGSCPHQMPVAVEERVLTLRVAHPAWGPDRILFQIGREHERGQLTGPLPSRSGIYRALVRHRLIQTQPRKRRRGDYKRWERTRPMALWQMDVMGGVFLADGTEVKVVTGIDDHSRYVVCARIIARATARSVCDALRHALAVHGVPEQVLTDNGKVFTGRFATAAGSAAPVLFDRICADNGIRHILTAPYSPTTTGKIERLHKTMRAELFSGHDREWATIADAQAAVDIWVVEYNTERPHRSCGGRPPAERFTLRGDTVPAAAVETEQAPTSEVGWPRPAGVSRWVDQTGSVRLARSVYRVGTAFAGQQVEVVVARGLVEILHAGVLIATHVQRRRGTGPDRDSAAENLRAVPARTARNPTTGLTVTRIVDGAGTVSFAGTGYRVGTAWARKSVDVAVVAGSVQISAAGKIIRVHAARHDPIKEHGAFAVPGGRPRHPKPDPIIADAAQAVTG